MPFIIFGRERYALPIGETPLGGRGDDALPIEELAEQPLLASVTVSPDGSAVIQRAGRAPVTVNGTPLADEPAPLFHGARLALGAVQLIFGDIAASGSTSPSIKAAGDEEIAAALHAPAAPSVPTADTGGRLVPLAGGDALAIPDRGLVIGRDPTCDLVLTDRGVSRRHAIIRPTIQGYLLTDASAHGVLVNGEPVDGAQLLGMGDVIRVGDVELRFTADPAELEPAAPARAAAPLPAAAPAPASPTSGVTAPRAPLLATLEVANAGPLHGMRFRIERPAVHVGRGSHNEVRLQDSSVSAAHATLTRRGAAWVVLDLGSTNGTYVDGERVTGERPLRGPAELRFGNVKTVFRPLAGPTEEEASTRAIVGVTEERKRQS